MSRKTSFKYAIFALALIVFAAKQCDGVKAENDRSEQPAVTTQTPQTHVEEAQGLEIPRLTASQPEQILKRIGYTASYNKNTRNANWVAWHLTKAHTDGSWKREGMPYEADDEVKGPRQETDDWYNHNLPIDHGHLCPAADNKWDKEAMAQTFLLTNMCPQNRALNRGDWEELESRCRGWARHYGEIYICAGPLFYTKNYTTIGTNKIAVPDAFFKVVLCMKKHPKALGFIYPNEGTNHKMDHYVVSIDEVEEKSGIDFFYALPDSIEDAVEAHSDLSIW